MTMYRIVDYNRLVEVQRFAIEYKHPRWVFHAFRPNHKEAEKLVASLKGRLVGTYTKEKE